MHSRNKKGAKTTSHYVTFTRMYFRSTYKDTIAHMSRTVMLHCLRFSKSLGRVIRKYTKPSWGGSYMIHGCGFTASFNGVIVTFSFRQDCFSQSRGVCNFSRNRKGSSRGKTFEIRSVRRRTREDNQGSAVGHRCGMMWIVYYRYHEPVIININLFAIN